MQKVVIGIDGFRKGWLGALWRGPESRPDLVCLGLLKDVESKQIHDLAVVAVDIPIGLLDSAIPGGRVCEKEARTRLGHRRSSVFSSPVRRALTAEEYSEALAINRQSSPDAVGLSRQSFALFRKLNEAQTIIEQPGWLRDRIIEVHPEVSFWAMAGSPMFHPKKDVLGKAERRELLQKNGFCGLDRFEQDARAVGAGTDDALDACAAAWTGWRHAQNSALCLPPNADGPNHSQRIWY